jgi:hypothetical protein
VQVAHGVVVLRWAAAVSAEAGFNLLPQLGVKIQLDAEGARHGWRVG